MSRPHAIPASPRRVLVISGSIGGGHHAAADAVAEAVADRWPDAVVTRADALGGMGPAAPRAFAGIYALCMRRLRWLYALYYALLHHVGFFRAGTRAVVGAWCGRGLGRLPALAEADLVVATFPEGVTGLAWLRRRGRLPVPAVAVLSDPAPQPLWLDAALDAHLVATEEAAARARAMAPGARVLVAGPPVVAAFRAAPVTAPRDPPRVYVAAGSLAFGDLPRICAAALATGARVVVGTGRDPALRARLERLGSRLEVRDWIEDPAAEVARADVVVTTGGGASTFEALAAGRPLVVVDPIPGHGRANARVLAGGGLATVCTSAGLAAALRDARPSSLPAGLADALARAWSSAREDVALHALGASDVPSLAPSASEAPSSPVRSADALFLHADGPAVPQVLGARVVVDDAAEREDWPAHLAQLVATRAPGIALLCRRLGPGRALRWGHAVPDPAVHVAPEMIDARDDPDGAAAAFFAEPLDPRRVAWRLQAVRSAPGEMTIMAAAHHSVGDGLAVTDALTRLFTDEGAGLPTGRPPEPDGSPAARLRGGARVARGIAALAAAGPAGTHPLTGHGNGRAPRRLALEWDGAVVRARARAHGVSTTVLVLALLAEALAARASGDGDVRAMVPMTTRLRRGGSASDDGNRTAAASVDLPTGPMPLPARIAEVARRMERATAHAQPEGADAVVRMLGLLPGAVQRRVARAIYGRRFFHVLASVMPGLRRRLHIRGDLVRTVAPVLPLADGVGLGVGALGWGRTLGVGITVDEALVPDGAGLAAAMSEALDEAAIPAASTDRADTPTNSPDTPRRTAVRNAPRRSRIGK